VFSYGMVKFVKCIAPVDASQHAKRFVTMKSTFVSNNQSPTIVEPRETPLDAPPLGVTCRRETRRLTALPAMFVFSGRNTRLDSARYQLTPEGVKAFIGNQLGHSGSRSSTLVLFNR